MKALQIKQILFFFLKKITLLKSHFLKKYYPSADNPVFQEVGYNTAVNGENFLSNNTQKRLW